MSVDRHLSQISAVALIDQLVLLNPKYRDARCVSAAYGQVYSQNNEDGILSAIFEKIGTSSRKFLEIAAGDGIENTTRLLLETGWTGTWVEAGEAESACIRSVMRVPLGDGRLTLIDQMISLENIDDIVLSKIGSDVDYVSVDIDYNTSHIWRALLVLRPRVFCIEYNAHYPPAMDYEVAYDPSQAWNGTTRFGASLKALERIAAQAGYKLVGCDLFGVNAFFVRDDLCDEQKFLSPFTAEHHYEPPRFAAVGHRGHSRHPDF